MIELFENQLIEHDFALEKDVLIQKSKNMAYENLPVGKILEEKSDISIIDDTMFAITTIQVFGIIN